ncbi:hypothetical protein [Dyadobacter sp. NIV53]|uniref:hypothetical protein n=1 Tax=Dyadobacter sp. NIV53 TaxID=2861765 RepID=UPI001C866ECE|nr:hypothetical protein [Dyadobacter sp. NIV53]
MEQVSAFLKVFFIITTFLTVWQFYNAANKSKGFLILILVWMALQFLLVQTGFYNNPNAFPPRLVFQLTPTLIFILIQFFTVRGRKFIDNLDIKKLTLLHTIRIPVEIVLYYLFVAQVIPEIMTFEERNFDIVAGITAPLMFYFGFVKNKLPRKTMIIWNLISLALLINIISIAILSIKSPFQQFGLNETNTALGYFPFNWLPSVVVPIVLFSHFATLRQLTIDKKRV